MFYVLCFMFYVLCHHGIKMPKILFLILLFISQLTLSEERDEGDILNQKADQVYFDTSDQKLAFDLYLQAAEKGQVNAMASLAKLYARGLGVKINMQKAEYWTDKSFSPILNMAKSDDAMAQYQLGVLYEDIVKDEEKASYWYRQSAENGNIYGMNNLAVAFKNGEGVKQSDEKALEWYARASEQGSASASFNLAVSYAKGQGVEQSYEKALELYTRASEQGSSTATLNVGYYYDKGRGVEQSYEKAVEWYTRASKRGNALASYNLGILYATGDGIEKSYEKSQEWYHNASEQGDESATYRLAKNKVIFSQDGNEVQLASLKLASESKLSALREYLDIMSVFDYKFEMLSAITLFYENSKASNRQLTHEEVDYLQQSLEQVINDGSCCTPRFIPLLERLSSSDFKIVAKGLANVYLGTGQNELTLKWLTVFASNGDVESELALLSFLAERGLALRPTLNKVLAHTELSSKSYEQLVYVAKVRQELLKDYPVEKWMKNAKKPEYLRHAVFSQEPYFIVQDGGDVDIDVQFTDAIQVLISNEEKLGESVSFIQNASFSRALKRDLAIWNVKISDFHFTNDAKAVNPQLNNLWSLTQDQLKANFVGKKFEAGWYHNQLGLYLELGIGTTKNITKALQQYQKAGKLGYYESYNSIARMMLLSQQKQSVDLHLEQVNYWLKKAVKSNNIVALYNLAFLKIESEDKSIVEEGWNLMQKAADYGLPHAQFMIERQYYGQTKKVRFSRLVDMAVSGLPEAMVTLINSRPKEQELHAFLNKNRGYVLKPGDDNNSETLNLIRDMLRQASLVDKEFGLDVLFADYMTWQIPLFPLSEHDVPYKFAALGSDFDYFMINEPLSSFVTQQEYRQQLNALNSAVDLKTVKLNQSYEALAGLAPHQIEYKALYKEIDSLTAEVFYTALARNDVNFAVQKNLNMIPILLDDYNYDVIEDRRLLACKLGNMGGLISRSGKVDIGIALLKIAVNLIERNRNAFSELSYDNNACFIEYGATWHTKLYELLKQNGRLDEARIVLDLKKKYDHEQYINRQETERDPSKAMLSLSDSEQLFIDRVFGRASTASIVRFINEMTQQGRGLKISKEFIAYFLTEKEQLNEDFEKSLTTLLKTDASIEYDLKDQRSVRDAIKKNKDLALVYYVITDTAIDILLFAKNYSKIYTIDYNNELLKEEVANYLQILQSGDDITIASKRFHDLLFAPIEDDINKLGIKNLFLSLGDILRYFPFSSLYDGRQYLIEKYSLAVHTSEASAESMDHSAHSSDGIQLSFFGLNEQIKGYEKLQFVDEELESISTVDGVDIRQYLNKRFNKHSLSHSVKTQYPFIHIASHFMLNSGESDDSYLLLGDGSEITGSEFGNIYTKSYMDDSAIDLITLSACNTGIPNISSTGIEVESLAVMAQQLGAHSVLSTLWAVPDDESVPRFMKWFYRGVVKEQQKKYEALRSAQLKMLREKGYEHPKNWSQYVLYGSL